MKYIANDNATIEASAVAPGTWTPKGTFGKTLSNKNKADGLKLILDNISWTPLNCTDTTPGFVWTSGASLLGINATSTKCFDIESGSKKVVLDGDSGTCTGIFTHGVSGATITCTCDLEVTDAGQVKVKGN